MIQQHKDPIESEIEGQVSIFHFFKKVREKKLDRADLMFKAYSAAYWLVKEKVWNQTLSSLADLPTLPSLHVMKNLQFSAQSSIGEIFFVTEQCKLLWSPNCWGYKCIFPRNKTENTETHSLWTENVLKLHIAANVTNTPNNSKKQAQPKGERL